MRAKPHRCASALPGRVSEFPLGPSAAALPGPPGPSDLCISSSPHRCQPSRAACARIRRISASASAGPCVRLSSAPRWNLVHTLSLVCRCMCQMRLCADRVRHSNPQHVDQCTFVGQERSPPFARICRSKTRESETASNALPVVLETSAFLVFPAYVGQEPSGLGSLLCSPGPCKRLQAAQRRFQLRRASLCLAPFGAFSCVVAPRGPSRSAWREQRCVTHCDPLCRFLRLAVRLCACVLDRRGRQRRHRQRVHGLTCGGGVCKPRTGTSSPWHGGWRWRLQWEVA